MNIAKRAQRSTPKFFVKIRTIGLILTALSGGILMSDQELPEKVVQIAEHVAIAGAVATTLSQLTVKNEKQ